MQENKFDIQQIRAEFPQVKTLVNNRPLIYFDNAATTLKPQCFIDAISTYYSSQVANVHRGVHTLSSDGTNRFEETRLKVSQFINANHSHEIIFTKGTTESINLLAHSFGLAFLKTDDEIVIGQMEHHSNIVPWQLIAASTGAKLKVIPIDSHGDYDLAQYQQLLNSKTKIVSVAHVSNTLGTVNPVGEMIRMAHAVGAKFCLDAAQSIAHFKIDVTSLDCDFLVFSAHKIYGPNGLGVLYGKESLLNKMPPYQGGGAMISRVSFDKTSYQELPFKFEAGTPAIAEVISFKASLDYIETLGLKQISSYENELLDYALEKLKTIPGMLLLGNPKERSAVISFNLKDIHPHDLGALLDKEGIAIRTGHHCTQPLLDFFNITAAARLSLSFYNTKEEIDQFISKLLWAQGFLL